MFILFSTWRFDSPRSEIFLDGGCIFLAVAGNRLSSLYPDRSQRCVLCVCLQASFKQRNVYKCKRESEADIKIVLYFSLLFVNILWLTFPSRSLLLYLSNKGKTLTLTATRNPFHSSTSAKLTAVRRLFEAVDIAQTHGSNLLSDPAQEQWENILNL